MHEILPPIRARHALYTLCRVAPVVRNPMNKIIKLKAPIILPIIMKTNCIVCSLQSYSYINFWLHTLTLSITTVFEFTMANVYETRNRTLTLLSSQLCTLFRKIFLHRRNTLSPRQGWRTGYESYIFAILKHNVS